MTFEELQLREQIKSVDSLTCLEQLEDIWYPELQMSSSLSQLFDLKREELSLKELTRD